MANSPQDKSALAEGSVLALETQRLKQYFPCKTPITHEYISLNKQAVTVNKHISFLSNHLDS